MADEPMIFRTQDTPDATRAKLNKLARVVADIEGVDVADLAQRLGVVEGEVEDHEQRIAGLEGG